MSIIFLWDCVACTLEAYTVLILQTCTLNASNTILGLFIIKDSENFAWYLNIKKKKP